MPEHYVCMFIQEYFSEECLTLLECLHWAGFESWLSVLLIILQGKSGNGDIETGAAVMSDN